MSEDPDLTVPTTGSEGPDTETGDLVEGLDEEGLVEGLDEEGLVEGLDADERGVGILEDDPDPQEPPD